MRMRKILIHSLSVPVIIPVFVVYVFCCFGLYVRADETVPAAAPAGLKPREVGIRPSREALLMQPRTLRFSGIQAGEKPARRKLNNSSVFVLYAENIQYDPWSKTLKAAHAEYRDAFLSITADEIRMDLSSSILAAEGGVLVRPAYYIYIGAFLDRNSIFGQSGYVTGDFLLMNYRIREGEVREGGQTTAFSASHNYSAYGDLYYYSYYGENLQILPVKTAPSLAGVKDAAFAPFDDKKIIRGRMLSVSGGSGLSILDAKYQDETDTMRQIPSLSTLTGELEKPSFHVESISATLIPGIDETRINTQSQYLFSSHPQSRGIFSASNIYRSDSALSYQPESEHDFNYSIGKTYYRNRNEYDGFVQRYQNVFRMGGSYLKPWSLNDSTYAQFRYAGEINDYESNYREKSLSPSLWVEHFSKNYFGILDAVQKSNRYDGDVTVSHDNEFTAILNFERKPMPVLNGRGLLEIGTYSHYFKSESENASNTEWDYKSVTANLYGLPIKLAPRVTLKPRVVWAYSSYRYDYEFPSAPVFNNTIDENDEHAAGGLQLAWRHGGGELGAEYINDTLEEDKRSYWRFFYTLGRGSKWNLRVSSDYLLQSEGDFAANTTHETADLSIRLKDNMHLLSSFALDDEVYGAIMNRLVFFADYPSGSLVFGVYKNNYSYYYYNQNVNPYIYNLAYYFTY